MPITKELDNINELELVGFSHAQSKTLTKIIEQAQSDSHESLKEFIRDALDNQYNKLDSKIDNLRYELKADIANSSKDLLIKLFAIIFGTAGILFAALKMFG